MPLKRSDRDAVKAAIQRGTQPAFVRDTLTLQLESRRIVLAGTTGRKTQAGTFYERETAQLPPRRYPARHAASLRARHAYAATGIEAHRACRNKRP